MYFHGLCHFGNITSENFHFHKKVEKKGGGLRLCYYRGLNKTHETHSYQLPSSNTQTRKDLSLWRWIPLRQVSLSHHFDNPPKIHPVTFFSRKLSLAKRNYDMRVPRCETSPGGMATLAGGSHALFCSAH